MRTAKARISKVTIGGKIRYRIAYPTIDGRKLEHFTSEKEANARLEEIQYDQRMHGLSATSLSQKQRDEYADCVQMLNGRLTLRQACELALKAKDAEQVGVPITTATESFIQSREHLSLSHQRNIRLRMNAVTEALPNRSTTSITTDDCQRIISDISKGMQASTVHKIHGTLTSFFNHCLKRSWIIKNPMDGLLPPKRIQQEIGILTPRELSLMLHGAPTEIIPYIVLAGFCGVRQSELLALDWSAVNLPERTVVIGASIAKTSSRRVCEIPECALAWLIPFGNRHGKI